MVSTKAIAQDVTKFVPVWKNRWTPPAGMLDFEEKWETFHNPEGRIMSCAHRGDINMYYPENSLEGTLSVIEAGADMVEIDIRTTADGILVAMHDETVTRTTNIKQLRISGQANDFPDTDEVSSWRFDHIRQLRLLDAASMPTDYQVPSLHEIILAAKDRAFITLDKFWNGYDWENGVYPLIHELKAYRTVLIMYGYTVDRAHSIQQTTFKESGVCAPYFADIVNKGRMALEKIPGAIIKLADYKMPKVLRGGEYIPEDSTAFEPILSALRGKYRIYAETLHAIHDNPEHWEQMRNLGYGIIMGNKVYKLIQFIANQYF